MFKNLIGRDHPEFRTGGQQDAREYWEHLLEKVQRNEKQAGKQDPSDLFTYEMESRVQCKECQRVRYSKFKGSQMLVFVPLPGVPEKGTKVELSKCLESYFGEEEIADCECPVCKKRTTFTKRSRFIEYPKTLVVVLQRFVCPDWVPTKLEIDLVLPEDSVLNLEVFRGNKGEPGPGEEAMPEPEAESVEPDLNKESLNQLLQMGIPEQHAKHALHRTGNNTADEAMLWYLEN